MSRLSDFQVLAANLCEAYGGPQHDPMRFRERIAEELFKAYEEGQREVRETSDCRHAKLTPEFDEEAAKALVASCNHVRDPNNTIDALFGVCSECTNEIRRRWPRKHAECPDCGASVIAYASAAHYTYGDW